MIKKTTKKITTTKNKKKMANRIKVIGKIKDVQFRNHSICGNPSYYVLFEDEKENIIIGYTAPNAECAYGCKNPELKEFAYIEYHTTNSGKIVIDYIFNQSTYERVIASK